LALGRERLLDLDDHLGARKHRIRIGDDLGAGRLVIRIGKTRAKPGIGLDNDVVTLVGKLPHRRGHEPDAIFVVLDLFRDADEHNAICWWSLDERYYRCGLRTSHDG